MAMPHGGGPRFSESRVAPHRAAPDVARGRPERGRFAAGPQGHGGNANAAARELNRNGGERDLNRHATGAQNAPENRHALGGSRQQPGGNTAERRGPPAEAGHETVGSVSPRANEGRTAQSRLEQRRAPIIRNQVFADQRMASRSGGAAQTPMTFRGRYPQSALRDHGRHHHGGIVLGFAGPLFWPYAYSDFVDYTFSPYAYDTFWPYAYDDVFAGIYGGYAPEYYAPEDAYAYAGSPASERAYGRATGSGAGSSAGTAAQAPRTERICSGEAKGVTDFAIQKIAQQVTLDQKQQDLLDDLKAATVKAVDIMQQACPTDLSSTPTGRLAAMRSRVDAMLRAVEVIRPALDRFYQSLNDEQRERFIAVDQGQQTANKQSGADLNHLCQGDLAARSGVPVDKIQRTLRLDPDQETRLKALDEATINSAKLLEAKCQPDESLTPPGRLTAMQDRLQVMLKALDTTHAALSKFYGSLSDEQKARFDRMSVRAS
jgi:hypothetical protein